MKLANNIWPQGDKILVLPEKPDDKTKAGILLDPNQKGKKSQKGTVLAISDYLALSWRKSLPSRDLKTVFQAPEHKLEGLSIDDVVLFAEYSGDDIQVLDISTNEKVTLKLLSAEHVLGIVTDPE